MANCLVGCVEDYFCTILRETVNGDSVAPYAKVFFGSPENPEITVGNNSSPQWGNTAIIKSLQVGMSDGFGCRVEILDEEGGAFQLFVDKLLKCMEKSRESYKMGVEFGWVIANCNGGAPSPVKSPSMYFSPIDLEINYTEGKIKFIISGNDLMQAVFAARHDDIKGSDTQKMRLKNAIIDLGNNSHPKFDVKFWKREDNGTFTDLKFKEGGELGPEDKWECDGQNKLATIRKWIEPYRTENDKGIIAFWGGANFKQPTLILLEDPNPGCKQSLDACDRNLGTFIVNGGKCSNVISFNPSINFVAAWGGLSSGGNVGGAGTGETLAKKEKECGEILETGIQQSTSIHQSAYNVLGPKNATKETQKSQAAYTKANLHIQNNAISGDLVIQGDPSPEFVVQEQWVGKVVSIVVINPFHISGGGFCGTWLASPGCNEVLTNRMWFVRGIDHTISDGSYRTTLKVDLMPPGITTDKSSPFGGPGSGGYVPANTC